MPAPILPADRPDPTTLRQLEQLPLTMLGEVHGSELRTMRRASLPARHLAAVDHLLEQLRTPLPPGPGSPSGWTFVRDPRLTLGADVLCPDLAGWAPGRSPLTGGPDWVCEAFDDGDWREPRQSRIRALVRGGVKSYWMINLVLKHLAAGGGGARGPYMDKHEGSGRVRVAPFEAVELDLERMWVSL